MLVGGRWMTASAAAERDDDDRPCLFGRGCTGRRCEWAMGLRVGAVVAMVR